ncbi:MAG: TolC family protein [Gammaproteobacteria bacterium]|nr:TolC family protein [Gammaproteobacteria bacterium]
MRLFRNSAILISFFSSSLAFGAMAPGENIWLAYQDAVKNDPVFQQQKATLQETEEQVPSARAPLFPQLFLSAQLSHTYQNSKILGDSDYNSNQYAINFSQVLFNASAFNQLYQARLSVQAAVVLFSAQTQDLIVRFTRAYLAVLQARDMMDYAHSQKTFSKEFLRMLTRKRALKFATITEFEQAKQQYQLLCAQYETTKITYNQNLQSLSNITALVYPQFPALKKQFSLIHLSPDNAQPWVKLAKTQNLLLRSAQLQVRAAEQQIKTKKTDFLPTVSATTNYSDTNELSTQAAGGADETVRATQTGISASWNFSQGGQTLSDIRKATAAYAQTTAAMQQQYLQAITNTENAFIGVQDGSLSVQASREAMQVGESGLQHVNRGFKAGVQSIFELLQAQNRLYEAQKQYTQNFYNYVMNTILLKQAAGTLSPNDVFTLNNYLYGKTNAIKK